jgi:hypothetical protein
VSSIPHSGYSLCRDLLRLPVLVENPSHCLSVGGKGVDWEIEVKITWALEGYGW